MTKIQTFIFIHDQEILLDFISHNKFSNLENLKYVFLGNGDNSKVSELPNVVISKNLQINIEEYPKLTSFTGWYALWKNNLVNAEYINLFEYDINLSENFNNEFNSVINEGVDVIGYVPLSVHNPDFIRTPSWSSDILSSINKIYGIDADSFISFLPKNQECSVTSNHTFNYSTFDAYMRWVEPMIDDIKHSHLSGHQIERSISLYYLINGKKNKILPNILRHFQFDSHRTQNICQSKFNQQYKYLFT